MTGNGNSFTQIIFILAIAVILTGVVGSFFWAVGDAEKRGKSGCLVALLFFLLPWPVGLVIWLLVRPALPPAAPG